MKKEYDPEPRFPFELAIKIGGEDWKIVQEIADRVAEYVQERTHESCGIDDGIGNGWNYSIHKTTRDVSVEKFRKELEEWRQRQIAKSRKIEKESDFSEAIIAVNVFAAMVSFFIAAIFVLNKVAVILLACAGGVLLAALLGNLFGRNGNG